VVVVADQGPLGETEEEPEEEEEEDWKKPLM
jgi:hypothetical protein